MKTTDREVWVFPKADIIMAGRTSSKKSDGQAGWRSDKGAHQL